LSGVEKGLEMEPLEAGGDFRSKLSMANAAMSGQYSSALG
jgi:hypothetical protein